jgi:predicted nucleic acid-binding protein
VLTEQVSRKAKALMSLSLKQVDAAHLACAISTHANYFITTDKKILKTNVENIKVVNPIAFVQEYPNEN